MNQAPTVLQTIVDVTVDATGSARGWLLRLDGESLSVAAAHDEDGPTSERLGDARPIAGAAGHAVTSGQAAALRPAPGDISNAGAGGHPTTPACVLAVPCVAADALGGDVVGVIELVDTAAGFTFDHVEVVGLLADVAAAALARSEPAHSAPAGDPAGLGSRLAAVADADPRRFADIARIVGALLDAEGA